MNEHLKANRENWDTVTPVHAASRFYDVEGFKRGRSSLTNVELDEVGDVTGKSLLHLQCHFGMDTLSWARRGAAVVGMDFSRKAITLAQSLAAELDIPARFVCCDLYDLPEHLSDMFDIVCTTRGVLCWLPDIKRWGEIVAHFTKPGGLFYVYEFHPFASVFDDAESAQTPAVRYPYFHTTEPRRFVDKSTYASSKVLPEMVHYEWTFSIGDVVNGLVSAGFRIEFLHEFQHCTFRSHPFLTQGEDGLWRCKSKPDLPLMFSIKAVRA